MQLRRNLSCAPSSPFIDKASLGVLILLPGFLRAVSRTLPVRRAEPRVAVRRGGTSRNGANHELCVGA
jgi:hypothetical protein